MKIEKLQQLMDENGLDAFVINAGPSLYYFTGLHFRLSERPVVVMFHRNSDPVFILPELEESKLGKLPFRAKVYTYGEEPDRWPAIFQQALSGLQLKQAKVGVEPNQLRFLEYELLRGATTGCSWSDGSSLVAALRARKNKEEINFMKEAVRIAEKALESTLPKVRAGVTEKEVAGELFLQLTAHGSESELPFSPIVASGPNSAKPHATPTSRKLQSGDLLIIDWGARYEGYASDLTRTFAIGDIGDVGKEEKEIHRLVREANRAGREAGHVGGSCAQVDLGARKVIEDGGYGEFFTHRTGHGIGLEVHEDPYIRSDNLQALQSGMTYTVEPGIYLPGKNGVRIEDDVLMTDEGGVSLSTISRELMFL